MRPTAFVSQPGENPRDFEAFCMPFGVCRLVKQTRRMVACRSVFY